MINTRRKLCVFMLAISMLLGTACSSNKASTSNETASDKNEEIVENDNDDINSSDANVDEETEETEAEESVDLWVMTSYVETIISDSKSSNIDSVSYEYNDLGQEILRTSISKRVYNDEAINDELIGTHTVESVYDEEGDLIGRTENYYEGDDLSNPTNHSEITYVSVNDEYGNPIELNEEFYEVFHGEEYTELRTIFTANYEYDDAGNLIYEQRYEYNGDIYEYQYDTLGNVLTEKRNDKYWFEYTYDEAGYPLTISSYDSNGTLLDTANYEYDEEGRIVKEPIYNNDKAGNYLFQNYQVYEYDENDNVIRITCYMISMNDDYYFTLDYTYDDNGNLLSETRWNHYQMDIMSLHIEYTWALLSEVTE